MMPEKATEAHITPLQVRRIAKIALYSPAVCLLRAFMREGLQPSVDQLLPATLTSLRSFFNKPYARAIVQRVSQGRTYPNRSWTTVRRPRSRRSSTNTSI